MPTVAERLAAEIASQQSEVDRLKLVCDVDYPKALATLAALKRLADQVTPEREQWANDLATVGIEMPIKVEVEVKPPVKGTKT